MNIRAEIFGGPDARKSRLLISKKPKQDDASALTDVVIPRQEPRRTDMRHEDRPLVSSERFKVTYRGRTRDVAVINLSGGGAMIAADLHADICESIELHLAEGDTVECLVRWVKNGRLGVEFAHETRLDCPELEKDALLRNVLSRFDADDHIEMLPVAPDPVEGRRADRHPLIWSGELHYDSRHSTVRLRNISATGTMVQTTAKLRAGHAVILDLGEAGSLEASISWVAGDLAGLRFAAPFDIELLSECKPRVTPPTWLRPDYLKSDASAESAWDGPWNRMSLKELRTELEGFLKR